jgi:hypothetical protein
MKGLQAYGSPYFSVRFGSVRFGSVRFGLDLGQFHLSTNLHAKKGAPRFAQDCP